MSADSVKSHAKFRAKYALPFHLLADVDHAVCDAYGVWQEKKFMGKTYMGISRTTYVIDATGNVAKVFEKVSIDGHADEVREAVAALEG